MWCNEAWRRTTTVAVVVLAAALTPRAATASRVIGKTLDGARIEKLTGARGQLDSREGVFKVSVPRSDLRPAVAGARIVPAQGLISWAAFQGTPTDARVMGDLVLSEDQVNPVMSVALDNGLEVTALHNHFLWDSPRVMFMHIGGAGNADALASAVGQVFAKIEATSGGRGETLGAAVDPSRSTLDPSPIEKVLGVKGASGGGVFKVVVGRVTSMDGMPVGKAMGVNTWAAFAGSDERAVVDGDFAVLETELQPVLRALRAAGIGVAAIHQHMTGDVPHILFIHYWGVGPTVELARGLRAALDRTTAGTEAR